MASMTTLSSPGGLADAAASRLGDSLLAETTAPTLSSLFPDFMSTASSTALTFDTAAVGAAVTALQNSGQFDSDDSVENFTRDSMQRTDSVPWFIDTTNEIRPALLAQMEITFLIVLELLCLSGNLLLILTIYRCVELRNLSNYLILNLAAIGILLSVIVLPSWIITTLSNLLVVGEEFCQASAMFMLLLFLEAILTLAMIAVDRYGNICHPFRYPMVMSCSKGLAFVACSWLLSASLSVLPFFGFGRYGFRVSEVPLCTVDFGHQPDFSTLILCLVIAPSCAVIFASNWRILSVARDQARKVRNLENSVSQNVLVTPNDCEGVREPTIESATSGRVTPSSKATISPTDLNSSYSTNGERPSTQHYKQPPPRSGPPPRPRNALWQIAARSVKNSVRQTRAFRTVFTIIGCFLLSWTAYTVLIVCAIHSNFKAGYAAEFAFTYLALANYVANPVICVTMNKEFRNGVKKVFGLHRKKLLEEVVNAWMANALTMAHRRNNTKASASSFSRGGPGANSKVTCSSNSQSNNSGVVAESSGTIGECTSYRSRPATTKASFMVANIFKVRGQHTATVYPASEFPE